MLECVIALTDMDQDGAQKSWQSLYNFTILLIGGGENHGISGHVSLRNDGRQWQEFTRRGIPIESDESSSRNMSCNTVRHAIGTLCIDLMSREKGSKF